MKQTLHILKDTFHVQVSNVHLCSTTWLFYRLVLVFRWFYDSVRFFSCVCVHDFDPKENLDFKHRGVVSGWKLNIVGGSEGHFSYLKNDMRKPGKIYVTTIFDKINLFLLL